MSDIKRLAGSSVIYAIGSFGSRALALLLLPIYTRFLSPSDYGVVSIAAAATSLMLVLSTLNLHGSLTYIWFKSADASLRKRDIGSVWLTMTAVSLMVAFVATWTGTLLPQRIIGNVSFDPYIKLAIWIAVVLSLSYIPLNLLQAEERPAAYAMATLAAAIATATAILWQVVLRRNGAEGYLYGMLFGGLAMVPVYLAILRSRLSLGARTETVRLAFAYSLPLVPHGVAAWLLELSDRFVLERFVPLTDVGLYSLGYVLSAMVYIVAAALNQAWLPVMFRRANISQYDAAPFIAEYATYFFFAIAWFALGLALFAKVVLMVLAAPEYAGAVVVMPIVILAMVMHGAYLVPVGLLFQAKRTWPISFATLTAGGLNVAANLTLVPYFGIRGAAIATLMSYTLMLVLVWRTARTAFPVPYQYRRLAKLGGIAIALYLVDQHLPESSLPVDLLLKLLLWGAMPIAVWFGGLLSDRERSALRGLFRHALRARGAGTGE